MDLSFPHFFRPTLRAAGVTLVLLFLIGVLIDGPPSFADPQARVLWVSQFLSQSPVLVTGVLFLLVSLGEHWRSEPLLEGAPRPGQRDGLLMRLRPLVLVLAALYLALIPFTLFSYNTIRLRGNQQIEQEVAQIRRNQAQLRRDLESNPGPLPTQELLRRYPFLAPAGQKPRPIAFYRERLRDAELRATLTARRKRESAEGDLLRRNLRILLASLLYAATFHYFWRYWPRYPASLPPLPYEDEASPGSVSNS